MNLAHGFADRVALSAFSIFFCRLRYTVFHVTKHKKKRKSHASNTRTLSTLVNSRSSVFDGGALRLRNYSTSSDTMWTKVRLQRGGYILYILLSDPKKKTFSWAMYVLSAATKNNLKAYLRVTCYT